MELNLNKNESFDFSKSEKTINEIEVQLYWTTTAEKEVDLDVSAFMLNREGKLDDANNLLFFNNESILDETVAHGGDNRTGNSEIEPDETILFKDLNSIPNSINSAKIVITVHQPTAVSINNIRSGSLVIKNLEDNEEILNYKLPNFTQKSEKTYALIVGELLRKRNSWEFKALEKHYTYPKTKPFGQNSLELVTDDLFIG